MNDLPPNYTIHVGTDGRLTVWYQGEPLTPGLWWSGNCLHYARRECYNDYAERTATHLEETKQKYRELYQTSGWNDYLRQALDQLNDGVYCLQEYVCILLSNLEWSLRNAQEKTGRDREVHKQMAAMNRRKLTLVVTMLQDLQVDIPRTQTWPQE